MLTLQVTCEKLVFNGKMNKNIVVLFFYAAITPALTETTKETYKDVHQSTLKIPISDYVATPDSWESNPNLKSLWVYRPASLQPHQVHDDEFHSVVLKAPHLLTKLAKPLALGVDPYFNKDYFEPFERRRKPVTLVAFRKRGLLPRKNISPSSSMEVAELQSPYNEINSFWPDDSGFGI